MGDIPIGTGQQSVKTKKQKTKHVDYNNNNTNWTLRALPLGQSALRSIQSC